VFRGSGFKGSRVQRFGIQRLRGSEFKDLAFILGLMLFSEAHARSRFAKKTAVRFAGQPR